MAKVSAEFGRIISEFLHKKQLSLRAAALRSGVSAAYWNDMAGGRVPSEEIISKICDAYQDLDETLLRDAAGLAPKWGQIGLADAVALYLRHNQNISEEGIRQVVDFVNETVELAKKRGQGE